MSDGIQFERVAAIGDKDEPGDAAKHQHAKTVVEAVQREADYLRGKTDAYYEVLELLKATNDDHESETS